MKKTPFVLVSLLVPLVLAGCSQESPVDAPAPTSFPSLEEFTNPTARAIEADVRALQAFDPERADDASLQKHFGLDVAGAVRVPAGSVDAIGAAIAQAGPGGVVRIARGVHTESSSIEITFPVTILGERGAVIEVATLTFPESIPVDAAFHVNGANVGRESVTIVGLEIRPSGDVAGAGILIENTAHVAILYNSFVRHQDGIVVEQGDEARIIGNRIEIVPEIAGMGIAVVNGDRVGVSGNTVSGSVFGLWACDEDGYAVGNDFSTSLIGLIYCKVPADGYVLPGGGVASSEHPATRWFGALNRSHDNVWGYMVVDGANNSTLAFNDARDNGLYDVHVTPSTEALFGFCTPVAVDNTVVTTDDGDVIKDCGIGSTILGGTLVDLSVDPCEPPCAGSEAAAAPLLRGSARFAGLVERLGR